MGSLLISLLTLVLLLVSAFIVLIVLMQRTSQSGGMGAALGGGAAESAFGSETNSILMKGTVYGIVAFFIVALGLYLLYQSEASEQVKDVDMNAVVTASEEDDSADTLTSVIDGMNVDGTEAGVTESIEDEAAKVEGEVEAANPAANPAANEAANEAAKDLLPSTN